MIDKTTPSEMRDKLNAISPSLCIAKWAQVSINLPAGLTQSCYHPPAHPIPLVELTSNPAALHNTKFKIHERRQMMSGDYPDGCSYCWKIEDNGHISDRAIRSNEWWASSELNSLQDTINDATPRYLEVNFNQACNFKCMYCSPHLSTTWEEDITKYGPYKLLTGQHNDIAALQAKGLMPLKVANKDNPYVQAFWDWWPQIYRKLRVFRMTGGEPLMDKNTFKVLDYVNENPHGNLELSITSNLCPPTQALFEKFITKIQALEETRLWWDNDNINPHTGNTRYIAHAYKHFILYVSLDAVDGQAEYIRSGLNYKQLIANVRTYLSETKYTSISFINTFNILSIPRLKQYLQLMLDLRLEFSRSNQKELVIPEIEEPGYGIHPPYTIEKFARINFDMPILEYPNWLSVHNAKSYPKLIQEIKDCIAFMEANPEDSFEFTGFKQFEIDTLKRNLSAILNSEHLLRPNKVALNKAVFYQFVTHYDSRNYGKEFLKAFPELTDYYYDCHTAYATSSNNNEPLR